MQAHIHQASQNIRFVKDCSASYPEIYFDWKITAIFYTAHHLIKALCVKREVSGGKSHQELDQCLKLDASGRNSLGTPRHVVTAYRNLKIYSEEARYDGFLDPEDENEVQRANFLHSQNLLNEIKKYCEKNKIICDESEDAA